MKNSLLSLLLIFSTFCTQAQTSYKPNKRFLEAGFFLGLANYSGDLAEKSIEISETRFGYGAFARYFLNNRVSLKAQIFSCTISGDDSNAKDPAVLARRLRFSANVLELGLAGEWHILGRDRISSIGEHKFFVSPYLSLGGAISFAEARTEYYGPEEDRDEHLAVSLPEPGLRRRFLLAPIGLGLRADFNEALSGGLELGVRPVFSDGLDGVRLNGNPNKNDWYYFGGATISFVLSKPKKQI